MSIFYVQSPLGALRIEHRNSTVVSLCFTDENRESNDTTPFELQIAKELDEYFSGIRTKFNFALHLEVTDFQKEVLTYMQRIAYGTVVTYGDLAYAINKKKAAQAVGNACGSNPIPIIIPCHRVVAKGGLGGFSAGIERKVWLLKHEGYLTL